MQEWQKTVLELTKGEELAPVFKGKINNTMKRSKIIGEGLKAIRKKKGMSREELSMYTGLAERTIQNIELGYNFSSKSIEVYMDALDVKACEFYV